MSESSFKVEMLLGSVKELRQGKLYLEQKLKDKRAKNGEIHQTLDGVLAKHDQAADMNFKIKELLTVAQHKITQTQVETATLRDLIAKKSQRVEEFNKYITAEGDRKTIDTQTFCDQLSEIASQFSSAREANKSSALEGSIEKQIKEIRCLEVEAGHVQTDMESLQKEIDALSLGKDDENLLQLEISEQEQRSAYEACVENVHNYEAECGKNVNLIASLENNLKQSRLVMEKTLV